MSVVVTRSLLILLLSTSLLHISSQAISGTLIQRISLTKRSDFPWGSRLTTRKNLIKRTEITVLEEARPKLEHAPVVSELASTSSDLQVTSPTVSSLQPLDLKPYVQWLKEHPQLSVDDATVPFGFDRLRKGFIKPFRNFIHVFHYLKTENKPATRSYMKVIRNNLYNDDWEHLRYLLQVGYEIDDQDAHLQRFEESFFAWFIPHIPRFTLSDIFPRLKIALASCVDTSEALQRKKASQAFRKSRRILKLIYQSLNLDNTMLFGKDSEKWNHFRPLLKVDTSDFQAANRVLDAMEKKFGKILKSTGDRGSLSISLNQHLKTHSERFQELWQNVEVHFLKLIALQKMMIGESESHADKLRSLMRNCNSAFEETSLICDLKVEDKFYLGPLLSEPSHISSQPHEAAAEVMSEKDTDG